MHSRKRPLSSPLWLSLRGLLSLREEVASHGGRVRLVVAEGSRVERTLRLLEFAALFPIFRAAEEAWRA